MIQISLASGFVFDAANVYGKICVTAEEMAVFSPQLRQAHAAICAMRESGEAKVHVSKDGAPEKVLFYRLPYVGDRGLNTPERLAYMEAFAEKARGRVDAVILYGVGGSYLGGKVLFDAHCGTLWNLLPEAERHGRPKIFFAGNNADPRSLSELLRFFRAEAAQKDEYRVMHVVISKSGTTIEPMAGYIIMEAELQRSAIATETVAVTSPAGGADETLLHRLARESNWPVFFIPDGVGGRFSVFSEAGLLTGALTGFSLRSFLDGARAMDKACRSDDITENPALLNGALKYLAAKNHGRSIEVFMPYADCLKSLSEWYVQLLAESLGKRLDRNGQVVNYGRTPVVAVGTTDMHAQTQEHQEGPQDKIIQFVSLGDWQDDLIVPETYNRHAGLDMLSGVPLSWIMSEACRANAAALAEDNRPSANYILPELNAFHLGELMYLLCLSVAYEGELADVDAFDQPGVEIYKRHLRASLKALQTR